MRQVIEKEYRHKFRVIVFAIFEDKNSTSDLNPIGNGLPFAETFDTKLLSLDEFVASLRVWKAANK
jgi:hypothetical protein